MRWRICRQRSLSEIVLISYFLVKVRFTYISRQIEAGGWNPFCNAIYCFFKRFGTQRCHFISVLKDYPCTEEVWGTRLTLREQFPPYQIFSIFSWKENWVQKNSQVGKSGRKTENTPKPVGLKIQNFSVKSVKRIARYRSRNRWAPDRRLQENNYGFASRSGKLRNTFHGPSNVNLNGRLFSAWREIRNLAIIMYWMKDL